MPELQPVTVGAGDDPEWEDDTAFQEHLLQHQRAFLQGLDQDFQSDQAARAALRPATAGRVIGVHRRLSKESSNFVLPMQPYMNKSTNYHTGALPSFRYSAENPYRHGRIFDLVRTGVEGDDTLLSSLTLCTTCGQDVWCEQFDAVRVDPGQQITASSLKTRAAQRDGALMRYAQLDGVLTGVVGHLFLVSIYPPPPFSFSFMQQLEPICILCGCYAYIQRQCTTGRCA